MYTSYVFTLIAVQTNHQSIVACKRGGLVFLTPSLFEGGPVVPADVWWSNISTLARKKQQILLSPKGLVNRAVNTRGHLLAAEAKRYILSSDDHLILIHLVN